MVYIRLNLEYLNPKYYEKKLLFITAIGIF